MDDVTNTISMDKAAEPQQPTVRVRVVDATTRKTMTDEAEVVFVPCADSEPIKVANAALQDLPARRFLVKATAPGYAQLNYVDGPINIYHDHLVVDQDGRPQKEVVIMMERRVAAVWLSVSDCRDGRALPTASVQLLDGDDVAHVFDAPGSHDVAAVTSAVSYTHLTLPTIYSV